jgi:hypothetical protein
LISSASQADSVNQSIRELMSPEQFRAAGLEKLNDAELEALDAWLQGRRNDARVAPASVTVSAEATTRLEEAPAGSEGMPAGAGYGDSMEGFGLPEPTPAEKYAAKEMRAVVLPPFRGWNGKTVFKLDNGQVWQQRVSGRYTYGGDDRNVAITVNNFGFYELELLSVGRVVGVKRIK